MEILVLLAVPLLIGTTVGILSSRAIRCRIANVSCGLRILSAFVALVVTVLAIAAFVYFLFPLLFPHWGPDGSAAYVIWYLLIGDTIFAAISAVVFGSRIGQIGRL